MNPEQGTVNTGIFVVNLSLIHGNGISIPTTVW